MRVQDYQIIAKDILIGDSRAFKIDNKLYVSPAVKYLITHGTPEDLLLLKESLQIVETHEIPTR